MPKTYTWENDEFIRQSTLDDALKDGKMLAEDKQNRSILRSQFKRIILELWSDYKKLSKKDFENMTPKWQKLMNKIIKLHSSYKKILSDQDFSTVTTQEIQQLEKDLIDLTSFRDQLYIISSNYDMKKLLTLLKKYDKISYIKYRKVEKLTPSQVTALISVLGTLMNELKAKIAASLAKLKSKEEFNKEKISYLKKLSATAGTSLNFVRTKQP